MVQDLRHGQELANGRAALDCERGEIGAVRLYPGQQFAQPHDCAPAGEVQRAVPVYHAPDRVVELAGVDAKVNPARAQPVGAHGGGQRFQCDGALQAGAPGLFLQRGDQRGEGEYLCRMFLRQPVGCGGEHFRIAQVAREFGSAFIGIGSRGLQRGEQRVGRVYRLQRNGIAFQPSGFLDQPEMDGIIPFDVRPPIHVIADPAGEAEWQGLEIVPFVGPAAGRFGQ